MRRDTKIGAKDHFLAWLARSRRLQARGAVNACWPCALRLEAGFLVRVYPEPCLILILTLLCSSKSKFIPAWTLTLLVLDKKNGLRKEKIVGSEFKEDKREISVDRRHLLDRHNCRRFEFLQNSC
jgi:hypothetical protein